MDGASRQVIFFRIILPLAKPAVAVTALFSFMTAWNEFILAATFLEEEMKYTAPVGLKFFVGGFPEMELPEIPGFEWPEPEEGNAPPNLGITNQLALKILTRWLLFLYLQKYLVSGLTAGGVKG